MTRFADHLMIAPVVLPMFAGAMMLALGIGMLAGSGVWLILRPRTFQVIIGLSLLSYAVNLFIIAMGLSRVFLGHHWLTDVMAGWLLGLTWVGVVILAHRLFHLVRRREHAGAAPSFDRPIVRDVVAEEVHHHGGDGNEHAHGSHNKDTAG